MAKQIKMADGRFVNVKSRVTKPLISMAHTQTLCCKIESDMRDSDMELDAGGKKSKARVCDIVDLNSGEEALLICSTVIESTFGKVEGGIVGKCFALQAGDIREGKKYRTVDIYEIDEPISE